jgi:hypothetical protein
VEVFAAAAAVTYLPREVHQIVRIPSDPLEPGGQIWTYYAHMAGADGDR